MGVHLSSEDENVNLDWEDEGGNEDAAAEQDTLSTDVIMEEEDVDPFAARPGRRGIRLKEFAGIYEPPAAYVPQALGNVEKMTIVDATGVHRVHVQFCECHGIASAAEREAQLLRANLFPTSFTEFRSAFTFDALDGFRAANLDCKTSAFHYYQMLRRLTSPAFHEAVPVGPRHQSTAITLTEFAQDRYKELLRLSRQWRNLQHRKRAGWGHSGVPGAPHAGTTSAAPSSAEQNRAANSNPAVIASSGDSLRGGPTLNFGADTDPWPPVILEDPGPEGGAGSLATFCATCPQPGVNIPDNWKEDPNTSVNDDSLPNMANLTDLTRDVYIRSLMDDGNFTAVHVYQPHSVDDVHLTAGEFFLAEDKGYKAHLAVAEDSKQVSGPSRENANAAN